jgi:hypothetical protein
VPVMVPPTDTCANARTVKVATRKNVRPKRLIRVSPCKTVHAARADTEKEPLTDLTPPTRFAGPIISL